ncbi:MAG: hypothetical protein K0R18_2957, partial [Bacillales bacterium]|nr:hypothetical protein [Bacillales bacterium]
MVFKKNQRKRISLFLVMIFVLSMVTGIFPTGFLTFASGIGQTSFMNFTEIKVTDIDGNPLAEPVDKDAEVRITYYFEIPNTVNVKEGDCVSITMPAQIANIGKKISEELQDDDGNTIAYADFNTDNTIDITFTGYIEQENLGDISGSFWIQRQFENTHVGNEGETDIVFNLNGQSTYVVKVTFEKVPEITTMGITKANTYDAEKNEINWEIKVTPSTSPTPNLPIEDVVLTDLITTNQTYVIGSFNMDCSNAEGEKFISPAI